MKTANVCTVTGTLWTLNWWNLVIITLLKKEEVSKQCRVRLGKLPGYQDTRYNIETNRTLYQLLVGQKKLDRWRSDPSIRPLAPFTFAPLLLLRYSLKPEVRFRCLLLLGQEPRTSGAPGPGATKPGEPAAPHHPRPPTVAVAPENVTPGGCHIDRWQQQNGTS